MRYKVYVDFTSDTLKAFYVGKGDAGRVASLRRNERHTKIVAKHGVHRVIIHETDDEADAFQREIQLIATCHTHHADPHYNGIGCNYTKGGEGASGWHHSEFTKQVLKQKCSGRKHTPVEIARQVAKQVGRRQSPVERERRSQERSGKRAVVQLALDGTFIARHESQKAAARALNVKSHGNIGACCRGTLKIAYGFRWRYA